MSTVALVTIVEFISICDAKTAEVNPLFQEFAQTSNSFGVPHLFLFQRGLGNRDDLRDGSAALNELKAVAGFEFA